MSAEVASILILVLVFLIATVLPIHMGILGFVAAFSVGQFIAGFDSDTVLGLFPTNLFTVLVGVTFLFAIARKNGTVDWLVSAAVSAVGGRVVLIPWVMFVVTGILTATGCVVPAAVAIVAPVGLGFALRYRINPVLMGLFIINGASAGGFSPASIFGTITNTVVSDNDLAGSPGLLFLATFLFNVVLSIGVFFLFGGRELLNRRVDAEDTGENRAAGGEGEPSDRHPRGSGRGNVAGAQTLPRYSDDEPDPSTQSLDRDKIITIVAILGFTAASLLADRLDLDPGFIALTIGAVLALLSPEKTKDAVGQVAWPTVLLICGIVTYVGVMEEMGTIDYFGDLVADLGAPLLSALLICFIGAAVSAFASTTGILGALIPLAVPFLESGAIGVVPLILALAISSSVVDSSPFSTSGALVVANAPEDRRDFVFSRLMRWGLTMILFAPIATFIILILPSEIL